MASAPAPQRALFGLVLTGSRLLDALLLAGVAAVALALVGRGPLWIFLLAALGLVPLAAVLGEATRGVALSLGPVAAGVLEGTLGNASELILAVVALQAGLVEVVKASLTGSIISNLLLVLGLALLCGGWRRKKQFFNRDLARSNATTLFLAAVGLVVPAVFSLSLYGELGPDRPVLESLSLWTAAILILIYLISLGFQLRTAIPVPAAPASRVPASPSSRRALVLMLAALVAVAILSELVVGQLQAAKSAFHGSDLFWGAAVFALIGNAAEHGVAIGAARRDEMDLAMAIGVGSSLQIALLLAPVLVFVSRALGHPMSLVFSGIEVVAVVLSTLMVGMVSGDGETTWLEGAQLLAVYAILAACFYFVPV